MHMIPAGRNEWLGSCRISFPDPIQAEKPLGLSENEEVLMFMDSDYAEEGAGPCPTTAAAISAKPSRIVFYHFPEVSQNMPPFCVQSMELNRYDEYIRTQAFEEAMP